MIIISEEGQRILNIVTRPESNYWEDTINKIVRQIPDFKERNILIAINNTEPFVSYRILIYPLNFSNDEIEIIKTCFRTHFSGRVMYVSNRQSYLIGISVKRKDNVFFKREFNRLLTEVWREKDNPTRAYIQKEMILSIL